jgi:2'-5' RNA ligase
MNALKIRTFIALEVSPDLKKEALRIQEELRRFRCRISWTRTEGMHLTLKFLGDTESDKIEKISGILTQISRDFPPFDIKLGKAGIFGGRKPRILWLGLQVPPTLLELQNKIENALLELGFPKEERQFHPHLTLGRVTDTIRVKELAEYFKTIPIAELNYIAEDIVFFRSDLKPTGAVYTPLKRIKFIVE